MMKKRDDKRDDKRKRNSNRNSNSVNTYYKTYYLVKDKMHFKEMQQLQRQHQQRHRLHKEENEEISAKQNVPRNNLKRRQLDVDRVLQWTTKSKSKSNKSNPRLRFPPQNMTPWSIPLSNNLQSVRE